MAMSGTVERPPIYRHPIKRECERTVPVTYRCAEAFVCTEAVCLLSYLSARQLRRSLRTVGMRRDSPLEIGIICVETYAPLWSTRQ